MTFKTNVYYCARCKKDHKDLEFRKFQIPFIAGDGQEFDYWVKCPDTGDPILLSTNTNVESVENDNTNSS